MKTKNQKNSLSPQVIEETTKADKVQLLSRAHSKDSKDSKIQIPPLNNSLNVEMLTKPVKRWLKQVRECGMITIECPDCRGYFGLDSSFVDNVLEVNFHYSCPYCHLELGLEA